jgi:hypothetical protein
MLNEFGSIWLNKGLSHSPETAKTLKLRTAETASQSLEQTACSASLAHQFKPSKNKRLRNMFLSPWSSIHARRVPHTRWHGFLSEPVLSGTAFS